MLPALPPGLKPMNISHCGAGLKARSSTHKCAQAAFETTRARDSGNDFGLLLELFRLEMSDEGVNNGLELPIHHFSKLVESESNAVVGHAVLRKIVRPDFLAAVAAAHHSFAFLGQGLLLLFHFHF